MDCKHQNTTEAFEMDGYADGVYQPEGLWWVCCRDCGRTVRLETVLARSAIARLRWYTSKDAARLEP